MTKCYICENETDFSCDWCHEPVCEDCCVPYTYHNPIEFPLCQPCNDNNSIMQYNDDKKREEIQEAKDKERKLRNKLARDRYRRPENITKRREVRARRKKEAAELAQKQYAEVFRIVGSWFK